MRATTSFPQTLHLSGILTVLKSILITSCRIWHGLWLSATWAYYGGQSEIHWGLRFCGRYFVMSEEFWRTLAIVSALHSVCTNTHTDAKVPITRYVIVSEGKCVYLKFDFVRCVLRSSEKIRSDSNGGSDFVKAVLWGLGLMWHHAIVPFTTK